MFEWKEGNGQVAGSSVAQADGSRPISTGTEQSNRKEAEVIRTDYAPERSFNRFRRFFQVWMGKVDGKWSTDYWHNARIRLCTCHHRTADENSISSSRLIFLTLLRLIYRRVTLMLSLLISGMLALNNSKLLVKRETVSCTHACNWMERFSLSSQRYNCRQHRWCRCNCSRQ